MSEEFDYSQTLFLPQTDFPMRAGLPKKEPEIIERWDRLEIYKRLRAQSKGRPLYVLHDGPPYANGNIHIGTALNKILKDVITRARQMDGFDSNYVPGWDCHGLPIEWKIEEAYRARGKNKDEVPINEFRKECREFAAHWMGVQAGEFRRLGVEGDFENPYTTMNFAAESVIAGELLKFALNGQLYRGSKPVMWSVVERTALAEAEVEYMDYESDTVWVKFPVVKGGDDLAGASIVIWTTTPWTMPGNRAISYSSRIAYALYEVAEAENDFGPQPGDTLVFADKLAEESFAKAKLTVRKLRDVAPEELAGITCAHPLKGFGGGYGFAVPLLDGDHVTDDAGTGFVHTAPGHGREDFDIWMMEARHKGVDTAIPFTVDDAGFFTKDAPGFGPDREGGPARVIDDKGKKGDANQAVISALIEKNALFARGRLKHTYPHSWRSKKPVIFRNTPQWFVSMDKDFGDDTTLRDRALAAIDATAFYPAVGQNRLRAMIENRPDWVLSRQRAWGVPIAVFVERDTGTVLKDEKVNAAILKAFEAEGADAWFADGAAERFLAAGGHDAARYEQVRDILDVWFDSGSTHAFCLEKRPDLKWPADLYLEGSDQHRGWFHSSLLESCGTRGRAPYDAILTHGFVLDEKGFKMAKSLGNTVAPQDVIKDSGADILRLWVASSDYSDDLRIGKEILKTTADTYRKLRNTLRWLLGSLAHDRGEAVAREAMPELERYVMHRLCEVGEQVRAAYTVYDFKRAMHVLVNFMTLDLSAFYFDIRKDTLYCDPASSVARKACLQVLAVTFDCLVTWLAPVLAFTAEEAWLERYPSEDGSVHYQTYRTVGADWLDAPLAARWQKVRRVRRVVTGALEIERREKRIGSSLDAAPVVYIADPDLRAAIAGLDLAEIAITSAITVREDTAPADAFTLDEVTGVAVVPARAEGRKCARSWKISPEVGSDPQFPDVTPRDAAALREWQAVQEASA